MKSFKKYFSWRTVAEVLNLIATLFFIAETIFSWLGVWPYYKVERIPLTSVIPTVVFLPGQKIRLEPHFVDGIGIDAVESAKWVLKSEKGSFEIAGLQPTITLPNGGGIVRLVVDTKIQSENKHRVGSTSLYIAQDNGTSVKYAKQESAPIGGQIVKSQELQLLSADNIWIGTGVQFNRIIIPAETELKTFDGKLLFRDKTAPNDLSGYGTVIAPKQ